MAISSTETSKILAELKDAREEARAIPCFSSRGTRLSLEEAYAIQSRALEDAFERGGVLSGYKLGLTSKAKQQDVGVHEPIFGFLLQSMEIPKGGKLLLKKLIHPRAEPELAVQFDQGLKGKFSLRELERAIGKVCAAIEVVDSRYEAFSFNLPDVVADNTSASHYVLGTTDLGRDWAKIRLMGLHLRKNGEIVETGCPAAVLGDPLLALASLSSLLAQTGRTLEPGMVVLTGGITASVPLQSGDWVEAVWPGETVQLGTQGAL